MKKFFAAIQEKMHRFFSGRYGYDELSRFLWIVAVVCMLLGLIPKLLPMSIISSVLLFYTLFRSFSRNISRRQIERNAYLAQIRKIKDRNYWQRQKWLLRDTYRFYRCKQCGKMLRVPKGKGKIKITCPGCKSQFIKKT